MTIESEELGAWLRLALTPGIGNVGARQLLARFGLPAEIFRQSQQALAAAIGEHHAAVLLKQPDALAGLHAATCAWLEADPGHRAVWTLADAAYPAALLQTEDPPLLLYAMGQLQAPPSRAVAVVGSRNPTPQGAENARRFATTFAQAGLTVVSGMALGIDTAAHEGALAGAAPGALATIAVVGTGLDRVYPKQNLDLAHRIARTGLILSEYHLGTPPLAENFPRRNRIISALGRGTLVVEAALKSGSLITARMAAEQGRDVFAIPGSIHATQARGCHALIKQGAKLVETAQDVLEELRFDVPRAGDTDGAEGTDAGAGAGAEGADADPSSRTGAANPHAALLTALGHDAVTLDTLQARTGLPTARLQADLLELELAGAVARIPGGLYQRLVTA